MRTRQSQNPEHQPSQKRVSAAVERLYVYWIVSTVLLLFAVIVSTLYTRGALYGQAGRQAQRLDEIQDRIAALEQAVAELRQAPRLSPASEPAAPRPARAKQAPPTADQQSKAAQAATRAEERSRTPATTRAAPEPTIKDTTADRTAVAPAGAPAESEINAQLDQALTAGTLLPLVIADPKAAENVVRIGLQAADRADYSGATWSRLAVLARLMSRAAAAETFARRAYNAGDPLIEYAETSARTLLSQGRAEEARMHAEHFAKQGGHMPRAQLLLGRVCLALDNAAAADELLSLIDDPAVLTTGDRLALARAWLDLHRWSRLAAVTVALQTVPQELESQRDFLRAVSLIQSSERLVEALGILDYLAKHTTVGSGARAPDPSHPAQPMPRPDSYETAVWRGVALTRGGQVESARQTLEGAARLRADRPDAHYWRAILELRAGQPDVAREFLDNALATSPRFAPGWEALASIALNAGELDAAIENAKKALEANERRASAHFLLALAHAKASRREPAAEALQAAFELDPRYLEQAKQAQVFQRLFTPDELKELALPPPAEPSTEEEASVGP